MSQEHICEQCYQPVAPRGGVQLSEHEGQLVRLLCNRCYNQEASARMGVEFDHPEFSPMVLSDARGVEHRFEFRTRLHPHRMVIEALEMAKEPGAEGGDGTEGYELAVAGPAGGNPMELFARLAARLRRDLDRRHLEDTDGGLSIGDDHVVRGRIVWDDDSHGQIPLLVIDGRRVSWEELGRMAMSYEGWRFKLEMRDPVEE